MDIQKFVEEIANMAPSVESFISTMGIDEESAKEEVAHWNCQRRKKEYVSFENPIEEFIYNYQVIYLHVGNLGFHDFIRDEGGWFSFGCLGDPNTYVLGYVSATGEVALYEPEVAWDKLGAECITVPCAKSAEAFLELFLEYSRHCADYFTEAAYSKERHEMLFEKALKIAGGNRYENFLRKLFQLNPPTFF